MYLTKIEFDLSDRSLWSWFADPQETHRKVLAAFGSATLNNTVSRADAGVQAAPLWRLEMGTAGAVLWVQSHGGPDTTGLGASQVTTRSTDPLSDVVVPGAEFGFRLVANPSRRLREPRDSAKPGKIVPRTSPKDAADWLVSRAQNLGFSVVSVDIGAPNHHTFVKRDGNKVSLSTVEFTGRLRVTDRDALLRTLVVGIGRGKAYGCGLLTLSA